MKLTEAATKTDFQRGEPWRIGDQAYTSTQALVVWEGRGAGSYQGINTCLTASSTINLRTLPHLSSFVKAPISHTKAAYAPRVGTGHVNTLSISASAASNRDRSQLHVLQLTRRLESAGERVHETLPFYPQPTTSLGSAPSNSPSEARGRRSTRHLPATILPGLGCCLSSCS